MQHTNCFILNCNEFLSRFLLLLVVVLGVVGCGIQHGRFVTTGSTSNALLSPVGSIDIIDGYESKPAHDTGNLNEQHLLYILIVTSAVQEHGSSSHDDYAKYVTTLNHTWNTEKGTLTVSIPWNRQTDIVTIGKQEFVREKGDVFIVRVDANGEMSGQQFASLGSHIRYQDVLKYVQQQLPNDELICIRPANPWVARRGKSSQATGVAGCCRARCQACGVRCLTSAVVVPPSLGSTARRYSRA